VATEIDTRSQANSTKVVFVMPRCLPANVRAVHKQALSLQVVGCEICLVVRKSESPEYLGMQVVEASAPFGSLLRPLLNLPSLFWQVLRLKADVYLLQNPDTIPLAFLLWLLRRKVIYDTHEDFSRRPFIYPGLPGWSKAPIAAVITGSEKLLARILPCVVVTQSQQLESIGGRTLYLPNAPLVSGPIVEAADRYEIPVAGHCPRLIYVGLLSENRGIFKMLDLVAGLNERRECRLELVGWILSPILRERILAHPGWRYVDFFESRSHAESIARIARADIALAILDAVADYPTSSITKLFEYMQLGVPFVASDFPAWKIPGNSGVAGLYVDPESAGQLYASVNKLLDEQPLRDQMGRRGMQYVTSEFNWERLAVPFVRRVTGLCPAFAKLL
jgi:glycosyltransferase involved in cell wall biosynthesis